jgi:hypothetical protein
MAGGRAGWGMTEQEWLECTDPQKMLALVQGKASDRKLRLFACACCRRIWEALSPDGRRVVNIAAKYADGLLTAEDLDKANLLAARLSHSTRQGWWNRIKGCAALVADAVLGVTQHTEEMAYRVSHLTAGAVSLQAVKLRASGLPLYIVSLDHFGLGLRCPPTGRGKQSKERERRRLRRVLAVKDDAWWSERQAQADLLRCIFPFATSRFSVELSWLGWNGGLLRRFAEAIEDECAFDQLPILADALAEAGCHDATMLAHCRGPGPHVRGCFVVDTLLART